MSKKKIILVVASLCMVAALAIVGSVAWFSDTDKATNSFTAGGVDIDLHEANKETPAKVDADYHTWLKDQVLMPGDNQTNTVAKRVYVENTGKSDAYVRVHIAIPAILDNAQPDFDASKNVLHFNATEASYAEGKWNWGTKAVSGRSGFVGTGDNWNYYATKIDNIDYNVYVVTYENPVAVGDTTDDAMHQVYLYKDVTDADVQKVNEALGTTWNIYVIAEGGQTAGFTDAFTALNTQFGAPGTYTVTWH